MLVDRFGVGELLDVTVEHDRDAVAHRHGFFLIVRDEHERNSESCLQQFEFNLHLFAQLAVERTKWLVEQQDARAIDECACDRDALLLTARHLSRAALGELGHLHHVERFGDARGDLRFCDTLLPQTVSDVFCHGHVREERVVLKDGVDIALVGRHALHELTRDTYEPLVGLLEAREHAQCCGLAATTRP